MSDSVTYSYNKPSHLGNDIKRIDTVPQAQETLPPSHPKVQSTVLPGQNRIESGGGDTTVSTLSSDLDLKRLFEEVGLIRQSLSQLSLYIENNSISPELLESYKAENRKDREIISRLQQDKTNLEQYRVLFQQYGNPRELKNQVDLFEQQLQTLLQQQKDNAEVNKAKFERSHEDLCFYATQIADLEKQVKDLQLQVHEKEEQLLMAEWKVEEIQKTHQQTANGLTPQNEEAGSDGASCIGQSESNDKVRQCSPQVQQYATIALRALQIVNQILTELDVEITDFYNSNDDANFFYVRRRVKFLESVRSLRPIYEMDNDLSLISHHGLILESSDLGLAVSRSEGSELESFKYFLYVDAFRTLLSSALVLVREMRMMPVYVDLGGTKPRNIDTICTLETELMQTVAQLGYSILDVELFKPMPETTNVECVGQVPLSIAGVSSGDVCEIVSLAILYGSATGITQVKIVE